MNYRTTPEQNNLVWYVSYGSNTNLGRLKLYLEGGTMSGNKRRYVGARNKTLPVARRCWLLAGELYFGACDTPGGKTVWGGGAAYIDVTASATHTTHGVGWLVTLEQLEDIISQENGGEALDVVLPQLPEAGHTRHVNVSGSYNTLVGLESVDGVRGVTFTTRDRAKPLGPAPAYLNTIVGGVAAAWGLETHEALELLNGP